MRTRTILGPLMCSGLGQLHKDAGLVTAWQIKLSEPTDWDQTPGNPFEDIKAGVEAGAETLWENCP